MSLSPSRELAEGASFESLEESDPVASSSPASTETSETSPPSTPPPSFEPAFTVVNALASLKVMLDTIVSYTNMPPKLFSKAHCWSGAESSSSKTKRDSGVLTEPTQAPPKLFNVSESTPELYVDAEGISLSRTGELSILIVHVSTADISHTFLIHVHVLGRITFSTSTSNGIHTLKTIFEDNRIPKVLFDCRMDSDALFGQYGVLLGGVIDLQMMCLAVDRGGGSRLPGLERCLLGDLIIGEAEREWVPVAKARGQLLWRPRSGGDMKVFNDDPLHQDIVNYCVVDAAYLPRLFETYNRALGNGVSLDWVSVDPPWGNDGPYTWGRKVITHSKTRVGFSLDEHFRGGTSYNPWYTMARAYEDDDY